MPQSNYIDELINQLKSIKKEDLDNAFKHIKNTSNNGGRIYICGNGGSAANAAHIANDIHYAWNNNHSERKYDVECLTCNVSILTCLGNDIGYENIFSHQIDHKGKKNDLLIVLSGSGNSENIVRAVEKAKAKGIYTIGLLGMTGGKCLSTVDSGVYFKDATMQHSEDLQIVVGHYWSNKACAKDINE